MLKLGMLKPEALKARLDSTISLVKDRIDTVLETTQDFTRWFSFAILTAISSTAYA